MSAENKAYMKAYINYAAYAYANLDSKHRNEMQMDASSVSLHEKVKPMANGESLIEYTKDFI